MESFLIRNARVIDTENNRILQNYSVLCKNGVIVNVLPTDMDKYIAEDVSPKNKIDASGMYLAPGYIDLHIHGSKGFLVDNGKEDVENLSSILPQYGVTSFLPTVTPKGDIKEDLEFIYSIARCIPKGAFILGFFLEGHFLKLTGAIPSVYQDMDETTVKNFIKAAKPYKVVFGISPEINNIERVLPFMVQEGYPAFITHTASNVRQTETAIKLGATHATHFYDVFPYNGDKEPGVRNCGVVETVLANPEVSVDFILDGEHVDPIAVKMALECKGMDKVCLVTDANLNAGMPPGKYKGIGDIEVEILYEGGPARASKDSAQPNALVGSGLTMDRAVKNAVKFLNIGVVQAVKMASLNPARVLNLHNKKGVIKNGYDADIILLDDSLEVIMCWVEGKLHFIR